MPGLPSRWALGRLWVPGSGLPLCHCTPSLRPSYDDPPMESAMSKRPHTPNTRLNPDPAAGNIRDPEQKNDELERHDTPKREDRSDSDVVPAGKTHGS